MSKFYQGLQEAVGLDFKASLNGKSIGDVKSKKFFWSTEEAVDKKDRDFLRGDYKAAEKVSGVMKNTI